MSNNQLIRIENKASFSPSELIILKARQDVQIHQKSGLELEKSIIELIYQTYFFLGYKITKEEMDLLAPLVMQDFLTSFRFQTMEEIKLAFYHGSRGEYGEFIGLNAARFCGWMRSFLSDKKRLETLAKEARMLEPKQEPTKEELFAQSKAFALDAFEKFKQEGTFNDIGNPVYEFLDSLNLIPFSDERKREIYGQAETRVKAKNNPQFATSVNERAKFEKILEGIEATGKDGKELVRVEARKIALNLFFAELLEMETELNELIN